MLAKQRLEICPAASRKSNVLRQFLRAGDHARRGRCRETHALPVVELVVLEGSQPLDLVEQWRWQAGLLDEELLGENGADLRGKRFGVGNRPRFSTGRSRPGRSAVVVDRLRKPHADD